MLSEKEKTLRLDHKLFEKKKKTKNFSYKLRKSAFKHI